VDLRIDRPDERGRGEILARSPAVAPGVLAASGTGWVHTGDVGYFDGDGYLYVVDRIKDVIIRGGENVAASEVEACLLRHPAVSQASVLGLPHDDLGEEVAAVVELAPDGFADSAELARHARAALAGFKVPTRWAVSRSPLPTNAAGKVLKRQLREQLLSAGPD
jgi:acyl-CoA synthetase (AMP-forming)/AMP-acid ligase II